MALITTLDSVSEIFCFSVSIDSTSLIALEIATVKRTNSAQSYDNETSRFCNTKAKTIKNTPKHTN